MNRSNPLTPARIYLIALVLSLAYALVLFPASYIGGEGRIYEQGDFAQHISGWQIYRADHWHWPLLHTERLNAPEGVSIVFTDSIPLLALGFKLLDPLLPTDFHYFGLWQVLVIILQGLGGVFLIRALGCRQGYAALAALVWALSAPVLAWRLGHSALMAHGLLLFGLGLYVEKRAQWLLLLALIGLLIHPYWYAMLFALYVVLLGEHAWQQRLPSYALRGLLVGLAATVAVMMIVGYGGSSMAAAGYGLYSMNLLAPFCDGRLYSCYTDATGGQYEGFNYLGIGVLLLLGWTLLHVSRWGLPLVRRHPGLLMLALGFTLYAVSHQVYLGQHLLINLTLPDGLEKLANIFRASGRFFWMVGYALSFAALAYGLRHVRVSVAVAVLAVLLPLQVWDVYPHWQRLIAQVRQPATQDTRAWVPLLEPVEQIHLHPAFTCAEANVEHYWLMQRLAGQYRLSIDTGYIARSSLDCEAKRAVFDQPFTAGRLYVLAAPLFHRRPDELPSGFRHALDAGHCAQWQQALLCQTSTDAEFWRQADLSLQFPQRYLPSGGWQWLADELPSNTGRIEAGELRPADPQVHDFLSFGPYLQLDPGGYRVTLRYRSALPPTQNAGAWDAVAAPIDGGRARQYARGVLPGSAGQAADLTLSLRVDSGDGPLEVRTVYPGQGDLRIIHLWVEPL